MNSSPEKISGHLLDNAPVGYLQFDHSGTLICTNLTLRNWLQSADHDHGEARHFEDLLPMGGKIYFQTHVLPILQVEGEISEVSLTLKGKEDVRIPVLLNARKDTSETNNRPTFSAYLIDITQRKMYETELLKERKKAEETARKLEQMNSDLEQFAYTASHDLQSPLRTIQGLISLLEKKNLIEPDSEGYQLFSLIKSNANQMRLMIRDLIEYSKVDETLSENSLISIDEVCRDAIALLKYDVAKTNATFKLSELPVVPGSKPQLIRLFQNLFENAIKYRSEASPAISVTSTISDETIEIYVKDNGIGFDEEYATEIFSFMKRLHTGDSIPGTGIGLTSCKRIMENHGGRISAESEPSKGSVFILQFPRK